MPLHSATILRSIGTKLSLQSDSLLAALDFRSPQIRQSSMAINWRTQKGGSTQTLSAGNIVTIALRLYLANGGAYLLTSLLANLWVFLIFLGVFIAWIPAGIAIVASAQDRNWQLLAITLLVVLVVSVPAVLFAIARFTATGGLLSRQMFKVLQQQTETPEESRQQVFPRIWVYARGVIWTGLFMTLIYIVLLFVGYLLYLAIWPFILGFFNSLQLDTQIGVTLLVIAVIVLLLTALAVLLLLTYIGARLLFFDVVLALEERVLGLRSVTRSWELTQSQGWFAMTVLFISSIILIPAGFVASLLNVVLVLPIAGVFFNIASFPFWQALKAVMYYHLRSRNEGLDFDLEAPLALPKRFLRRVCLQTPESIELDLALAGIGSRALGWLVDQVIVYVVLTLLTLGGAYLYLYTLYPWMVINFPAGAERLSQWVVALYILFVFVLNNGYYIIFETAWQGQTPGKRLAQIRVVQDNGRPIGLKEAGLRSILQVIDFGFFYIGVFLVAFNRSEKRVGDLAAGTLVIQDQQMPRQAPAIAVNNQTALDQLLPVLQREANVTALMPDQFLLIRNFLKQRDQFTPAVRQQSAQKLALQVRERVLLEGQILSVEASDEGFLEAVYLAYRGNADPE
jgi:uncharacterized RDD family membrane protein YckC